jgi:hypothetical protein
MSLGKERDTIVLKLKACVASASTVGMSLVGFECQAHVSAEHHLFVGIVFTPISSLELVFVHITIDSLLLIPSLEHDGLEVVVVEHSCFLRRSPEAIVSRVCDGSASESVSTRDGSSKFPTKVFLLLVNVVDKDI